MSAVSGPEEGWAARSMALGISARERLAPDKSVETNWIIS
jgi:hypothetical protein